MPEPGRKSRPLTRHAKAETHDLLVDAAACEFNERGFHGTDTNRIARRAGFAPQTFYRHFDDKTDMFIAVYRRWQEGERSEIIRAMSVPVEQSARDLAVAAALLDSHRTWRIFRRSLRLLAVEDHRIRSARAQSRRAQLETIGGLEADLAPWAARVAALLTIERLCDAAADEETADLGVDPLAWQALIADAVGALRSLHDGATGDGDMT